MVKRMKKKSNAVFFVLVLSLLLISCAKKEENTSSAAEEASTSPVTEEANIPSAAEEANTSSATEEVNTPSAAEEAGILSTTGEANASSAVQEGNIPSTVERVLTAMLECPNEELAPVKIQYITLDEEIKPDQESLAAEQAEEADRWRAEVGDCFAEGDFDYFMGHYNGRTDFHALAKAYSLTISIKEIEAEERQERAQYFNVTLTMTGAEGQTEECVTRWKVSYQEADSDLLDSIRIVDDGGAPDLADSLGELDLGIPEAN